MGEMVRNPFSREDSAMFGLTISPKKRNPHQEKSPVPALSSMTNGGVNGAGPQSGRLRSKLPEKKSGGAPPREAANSPLKRPRATAKLKERKTSKVRV